MTQRHYDIYVETVWNCASSKACSSVYLLDRAIGCCGMITTFTFGKEDGNQAEMLRTATLAAHFLNRSNPVQRSLCTSIADMSEMC